MIAAATSGADLAIAWGTSAAEVATFAAVVVALYVANKGSQDAAKHNRAQFELGVLKKIAEETHGGRTPARPALLLGLPRAALPLMRVAADADASDDAKRRVQELAAPAHTDSHGNVVASPRLAEALLQELRDAITERASV